MTIRLCSTCAWVIEPGVYAKCNAPQNRTVSEVLPTGFERSEPALRYEFCRVQRRDGWLVCRVINACGREGRWWSPRVEGPLLPGGGEKHDD